MRKTVFLAALALVAMVSTARPDAGIQHVPCGYQQITSLSSAQKLIVPTTCSGAPTLAVITAETQAVRYRDDGTAPTATVGMPLAVSTSLSYEGTLSAIQFIEQTASAKLNVLFYR